MKTRFKETLFYMSLKYVEGTEHSLFFCISDVLNNLSDK